MPAVRVRKAFRREPIIIIEKLVSNKLDYKAMLPDYEAASARSLSFLRVNTKSIIMNNAISSNSELNHLIPPEIKYDEFYRAIYRIARQEDVKSVLDIGSSSGEGSTEAFVMSLRETPNQATLFCIEISKDRFTELHNRYTNDFFVKCYNFSSVSLESFPNKQEVIDFYNCNRTNLNLYPLERVLSWLNQDVEYLNNSGVDDARIQRSKQENNIDYFDLVLIDGAEFTGTAELNEIYGAKYICLYYIHTFKNYTNHYNLLEHPNYILISQNTSITNGYSIFNFRKKDNVEHYFSVSDQLLLTKLVKEGMLVFDIGANIGDSSILLSKLVGSSGKVYSFEPTSSTFKKLEDRIPSLKINNTM
jgi:predicted O-methyltransferase YrrM